MTDPELEDSCPTPTLPSMLLGAGPETGPSAGDRQMTDTLGPGSHPVTQRPRGRPFP